MHYASYEEWGMTYDRRNQTIESRKKIRTLGEKETYKYFGVLEADTIKQVEMNGKFNKSISQENQKTT